MLDRELSFEDFLKDVSPIYQEFVQQAHDYMLQNGCKLKLQLAKNGYVVSYSHEKSKRAIINFVFRKSGLVTRIYGDCVNRYTDFMETLPDKMIMSIEKAPVCKRLINPLDCNPKCRTGYEFTVKGSLYQKCRYNCFMFEVNDESIPFIRTFLENEIRERSA